MRTEDIPGGLRLCRASGWNQVAHDWELFLASSPDGCRVAIDDSDNVIGSVATIRYGDAFAWIGMVLVDPLWRGAGIGTGLLKASLEILHDVPARLDATPAGRPVYAHSGFIEEYGLQRMHCPAPLEKAAVPFFGAEPMSEADLREVSREDRRAFGADRKALLHAFRRNAPEYAWVIREGGGIDGYVFGRRGYAFEHIGPLVARDDAAAGTLVAACLSARPDRPFIIDVPLREPWVAWLSANHFSVQRPFIRMARGERRFREGFDDIFAIAGPEFG